MKNILMTLRCWAVAALSMAALLAAAELALRIRYRLRVLPRAAAGQTIVALGDSIVAGVPGEAEDAWPALLAQCLQARRPSCPPILGGVRPPSGEGTRGATWRVVNAGVPGDTAPQGYARFERDVAAVGPRIVLIAFGLNDCNPARYGLDRWREAQVPAGLSRSYLWRTAPARVVRWGRQIGRSADPESEADHQPFPRTSPQGFANALDALVARTREIGAQPILLTMTPLAPTDTPEVRARAATYPLYNEIIRTCAARNRVPLIELALVPAMPSDAFESDGIHLTASGQAWVADQVFTQCNHSAGVGRVGAKRRIETRPAE